MPSRFVILHHRIKDGEHWDLMLEKEGLLQTWQLLRDPTDPASYPIPSVRIGDHRPAYLEYEGYLTGDRGFVTRVDKGDFLCAEQSAERLILHFHGNRVTGDFTLLPGPDFWQFAKADPHSVSKKEPN